LQKHYRQYGNDGYVLLFDFTKFFERVSHEIIKRKVDKNFTDERLLDLMHHFIDVFGDVGLGLGSQISQVLALASADRLDHFIKEELRAKYYARYMDDGYIIDISKERLQECRDKIKAICEELNITINESKTQIVKLSHGFTWLKVRFYLTDSGKIVKKIYKRSITKERQRLKKLAQRWRDGKIPLETVNASFQSWKSYAANFDAYFTTQNMTELYNDLISKK